MGVDGGDRVIRPRITMSLNFTSLASSLCKFSLPYLFYNSNKNNSKNTLHLYNTSRLILLLKCDSSKVKDKVFI